MGLLTTLSGIFKKKKDDELQPINLPANIPLNAKGINLQMPAQGGNMQQVKPIDLSVAGSNLASSLADVFKNVQSKLNVAPPDAPKTPAYNPNDEPLFDAFKKTGIPDMVKPIARQPLIPNPSNAGPTVGDAGNFIKGVGQLFPRAIARLGMTRDKLLNNGEVKPFVPSTEMEKLILGTEPIYDIQEATKRFKKSMEDFGISKEFAGPLAGAGVVASTGLDLIPGVGSLEKKGAVTTGEELANVLSKGLKLSKVNLDEGQQAVKVGWAEASKVLDKLKLDPELLRKLNAGEVIDGAKFVIQKQGNELLANIDKEFKPVSETISKGIKLKRGKAPIVEAPPPPTVNYVDPQVYADSLNTDTHLGADLGVKPLKKIKMPDYALEPGAIDRTQVEAIKSSINAGDKINPLVLDEAGNLQDGAHRLTALNELGIKDANFVSKTPKLGAYNAEPTEAVFAKVNKARDLANEKQAKVDYDEWQKALFDSQNVRTTGKAIEEAGKLIKTNTTSKLADVTDLKDIGIGTVSMRDVYRNFEKVYGDKFPDARQVLLDPFDSAKNDAVRNWQAELKDLQDNVVKGLGIEKGSKESALVQIYGEADDVGKADVLKNLSAEEGQRIVTADNWFRQKYTQLLDEVNQVRARIYPNDPEKIIQPRQDYYRHFMEIADGFQGLKNIFEQPSGIASELAGRSEFMKPLTKFLSFAQHRTGTATELDAVGGYLNYVKSAEYAKNIDPFVGQFRALADELAQATPEGEANSRQLTNFIQFLRMYADDLSGKTGLLERVFPKIFGEKGGRKVLSVLSWVNSRVKANVILGNASSSLSQIWNVPQAIADVGFRTAVPSAVETLVDFFKTDNAWKDSNFINERYISKAFDTFDTGMLADVKKFAMWMTSVLDEVGTKYIWIMQKNKLIDEGATDVATVARDADIITRKMVGGRGIGEVPLIQKDKVFQLIAPFQLEVANMWWVMRDWVSEKEFGKFAKFFVVNYFLNRSLESVGANPIGFDPIEATKEAVTEPDLSLPERGGRLVGEVLSQTPGANVIIPQFIGPQETQKIFGRRDPTRFGSGILLARGLTDPLFKLLPPFGGAQVEKSLQGIGAVSTGYQENPAGQVQYPIHQTPLNYIKGFLFGKYSLPEATAYYNQQDKPLGVDDTIVLRTLLKDNEDQGFAYYQNLLTKRDVQSVINDVRAQVTKAKLIITDPNASEDQKQKAYDSIAEQAQKAHDKLKGFMGKEVDTSSLVPEINKPTPYQAVNPDIAMPVSTPTIATGVGKKVKGKSIAIPKPKSVAFKIAKPTMPKVIADAGVKKLAPPPKVRGAKFARSRPPIIPKPRKFKVNKLRVTA